MVSSVTLGTFGTSNGKNIVTGGQSGLDTQGLINGLVTAKRVPAANLEATDKTLDSQLKDLGTLKTLLSTLQTSVDTLRNAPGADPSKNAFNYRTATETTNNGAAASNYLDVSVQPGAAIQNFSVTNVTSLAQQTKQQTDDIVLPDSTTADAVTGAAGFFKAGTLNLRAVDGTVGGVPITLNAGDSLQSVVNKFNAVSTRTGIQASLLTVSTGVGTNTYKIVYSSTQTGTTYGFDLSKTSPTAGFGVVGDPSGVLSQVTNQPNFKTTQTATDSQFDFDGVTITRQTNAVSDLLSGVTLNIKQLTAGAQINVQVSPDTSIVQNGIQAFVDAYNKFRLFASTETQVGADGLPLATAVLANNQTFQSIVASVGSEVSSIVGGLTAGNYSQLSDVGVKLDNFAGDATNPATTNIMTLNADQLTSALTANFNQVAAVFQSQLTADDSNLVVYKSNNAFTANDLKISINTTTSTYTATYTDPVNGLTTVNLDATSLGGGSGVTLSGQAGTALQGTQFLYVGSATTATINATYTHGVADRLYNDTVNFLDTTSGTLTLETQNITDQETKNKTDISNIDDSLVTYRDQLTQQYADLEAALSKANSLLTLLTAQSNARSGNNN